MRFVSLTATFVLVAWAVPAAASIPQPGDIYFFDQGLLIRFYPDSGVREVVSGCSTYPGDVCGGQVGNGPVWHVGAQQTNPIPQPDGSIIVMSDLLGTSIGTAFRVDPLTGNRTVIASGDDGGPAFANNAGYTVVPYFPAQVAALHGWGLAMVAGVLIGLGIKRLR